ncbi:HAMP domain-containing protein [candidate division KSB1 bacterium]|nr:HAMP domain-containing protein [candidate division KSB1 bacterium]
MLKDEVEPILENLHKYKEIETNKMVDELRTNTQTSSTVSLTIGIIAIIAGFVLSFLLGRRMSRPIVELTKAADAISLGNFSNAVTAKTKDEIGELAIAIERMRTSLQKAMDRLRRRK